MTRLMLKISFIFLLIFLHGFEQTQAVSSADFSRFIRGMGDKISQSASDFKDYLLELFYRFRAFFLGHSESTHQSMTAKGCGYAADSEPSIYNKQKPIFAKIKGGDDALWHTWPWIVALFTNPRYGWSCAGVLINENTILTAAHCLSNTNVNDIKAVIGVHTILGKLNPLNYYSISAIHRHPKFSRCCQNDLAILKLAKPVLYGPRINAACLPFQPYATIVSGRELINRTAVIIGWGDSSLNALDSMIRSFTLQQADVRIFDDQTCRRAYGSTFDPETEICAGDYEHRTDTMSGDSGGPLLIRQSDGRWAVLGITSYGAVRSQQTVPGVYAKISAHTKWIEEHMN